MNRFKQIIIVGLVAVISLGLLVFFMQRQKTNKYAGPVDLPTKVEAVSPNNETSTSVASPDGKKTLTMKSQKQGGATTYTFYIDNNLVATRVTSGKMSIPYNTWSVDDKHIFLKEEVNGMVNFYIEPEDINVSAKFVEKYPNYILQDMTGWAAGNLLIVNANDGKNDVSFWFDMSNSSFIPLSNRFN